MLQIRPVVRPTLKFTSRVATSPLLHRHTPSPSSPSSIIHAVPTQHQQRPSSSSCAIFTEFQPPPLLIDLPVHNHHHHHRPLQPRNRTAQRCQTVEVAPTKEEKQRRIGGDWSQFLLMSFLYMLSSFLVQMDLETENRIAAILLKEAAELRRQAQQEGVLAYLRKPTVRGRPNSRFLTATVRGIQQASTAHCVFLCYEFGLLHEKNMGHVDHDD
ncbi:hypothetical protein Cgig2_005785 [Carnegiea gigantea]|uniref:Uncharacterized protein n=1 Tax=Carnegiea gigantea TaxID=171969 RepID=A0A9Q1K098_9CARY|nr:hypothetical protein Cgig2_005785 [Carnegiea gigantea]